MQIMPEVPLLAERKTLSIVGLGTAPCRDIQRMVEFLALTGALNQLLATLALAKDPTEVRRLREAIDARFQRYRRNRFRPEHLEQHLSGMGKELLKDVALALQQLPSYAGDVQEAVGWFKRVLDTSGGVEVLLRPRSSGGHLVPDLLCQQLLASSIARPPLVVDSLIRPHRADLAAHLIFTELLRMLLHHDLAGADVIVLRDNQTASPTRSLEQTDRLAAIAIMAAFAARPRSSRTWIPAAESWKALASAGRIVGIWAERLDFKVHRLGWLFKRSAKDRSVTVDQTIQALDSVMHNQQTSLTGVRAASNAQNIFAVVGNITRPTFETVEQEIQQHGPCLFVPAPFNHIYFTRLANVDENTLAKELAITVTQSIPPTNGRNDHNLEWVLQEVAKRAKVEADAIHNPWRKQEVKDE